MDRLRAGSTTNWLITAHKRPDHRRPPSRLEAADQSSLARVSRPLSIPFLSRRFYPAETCNELVLLPSPLPRARIQIPFSYSHRHRLLDDRKMKRKGSKEMKESMESSANGIEKREGKKDRSSRSRQNLFPPEFKLIRVQSFVTLVGLIEKRSSWINGRAVGDKGGGGEQGRAERVGKARGWPTTCVDA